MGKIKQNLPFAFCALLGLLVLIFLALPHTTLFASAEGETETFGNVSGYNLTSWTLEYEGYTMEIGEELEGFGVTMSSILVVLVIIAAIAILALGVLALLKEFEVLPQFPSQFGALSTRKIAGYGLVGFAGLNVLLFFFLLIACSANTETQEVWGYSYTSGMKICAAPILSLVCSVGAVATLIVLKKKMPNLGASTEDASYVCTGCGKKAKSSEKFCTNCGGQITRVVKVQRTFACSQCGKPAKEGERFCTNCGGMITEVVKREYVCSVCGKPATEGERFCTNCGGQIITK